MTMTNDVGIPVRDSDGKRIEHMLAKGEKAAKIAARLTFEDFPFSARRQGRVQQDNFATRVPAVPVLMRY